MNPILKLFKDLKKEPTYLNGLFQTNLRVGYIFPIMLKNGVPTFSWGGIPVFNDCRGENVALELMHHKDFVIWAIDPWSGQINMKIYGETS